MLVSEQSIQHHPSPYLRRFRLPKLTFSSFPSNYPSTDLDDLSPTELCSKLELIALKNNELQKVTKQKVSFFVRSSHF
jgi:hypothetical protein